MLLIVKLFYFIVLSTCVCCALQVLIRGLLLAACEGLSPGVFMCVYVGVELVEEVVSALSAVLQLTHGPAHEQL